jgi:hypothetical protein
MAMYNVIILSVIILNVVAPNLGRLDLDLPTKAWIQKNGAKLMS